jgi:uridine kinase
MVCNVFILGRTGSGKSTVVRLLTEAVQQFGWSVKVFNDYPILREMYETDTRRRFRPTACNGFQVLDTSVYKTAIQSLSQQIQRYRPANDQVLNTIEFTSNNYRDSLQLFDHALLQDAYFFFVAADLKTCLERTSRRAFYHGTEDDYYVIDNVLLGHYPCPYIPPCIHRRKVSFVHNMGSLDDLRCHIDTLVSNLREHDSQASIAYSTSHIPAASSR